MSKEKQDEGNSEIKDEEKEKLEYEYTKNWDPFMVNFGGKMIRVKEVEKAIEFLYKNKRKKMNNGTYRLTTFATMKSRFRFIKKESYINRLCDMKKNGIKSDTNHMKFFIGLEMELETEKRIAEGEELNTKDYLEMFERIRKDHNIPDTITVNAKWVSRWKKENLSTNQEQEEKEDL